MLQSACWAPTYCATQALSPSYQDTQGPVGTARVAPTAPPCGQPLLVVPSRLGPPMEQLGLTLVPVYAGAAGKDCPEGITIACNNCNCTEQLPNHIFQHGSVAAVLLSLSFLACNSFTVSLTPLMCVVVVFISACILRPNCDTEPLWGFAGPVCAGPV